MISAGSVGAMHQPHSGVIPIKNFEKATDLRDIRKSKNSLKTSNNDASGLQFSHLDSSEEDADESSMMIQFIPSIEQSYKDIASQRSKRGDTGTSELTTAKIREDE